MIYSHTFGNSSGQEFLDVGPGPSHGVLQSNDQRFTGYSSSRLGYPHAFRADTYRLYPGYLLG
ncbi:hypothetical protein DXG03_006990 [Asterophora parasitica]|uniref:Uncharacterized protein n=1 Tax=Asterophora parasitica TaxID=117018 RepID=A0A9P7KHP6_9AGAR|nr:hypothetical protein DXG03_006990 [Asterophora parasitica]